MSQFCPLCGNRKPEEVLFCPDCKNKIKNEYEVNVPETKPSDSDVEPNEHTVKEPIVYDEIPESAKEKSSSAKKYESLPQKKRGKALRKILLFILIPAFLLTGGFFVYQKYVKARNIERSAWESALRTNTSEGYLAYMDAFPGGAHFSEAETKMIGLKNDETTAWNKLKASENASEFRDFLKKYPESPYKSHVRNRLDSLNWIATLNLNTVQGYSDYMVSSDSGELPGNYYAEAQKRYEMLFQSYPVMEEEIDRIKLTVDGFYAALSAVNYTKLNEYLAPEVYRFFDSGAATREKITRELLVVGAKTQTATLKFAPDITALQYQKTFSGRYKANVPLSKSYTDKDGKNVTVNGYIVHVELDGEFHIIGIHETKP